MGSRTQRKRATVERTPDRGQRACRLLFPSPRELRVCFRGPGLNFRDLLTILEAVCLHPDAPRVRRIVFDFRSVRSIESPWTFVPALLIDFARRAWCPCRIESIHGQAAAVFGMYQYNRDLRRLFGESGETNVASLVTASLSEEAADSARDHSIVDEPGSVGNPPGESDGYRLAG